jgi:hypothetical protein
MSLVANIDHLAIAAGIEAAVVDSGTREYRGDASWHAVLDGALDLFKRTEEKSIRLVVGKHTIVVQRESDETVAVVLPTGHAIAKSLRRMIRRMARKNRGPVAKPKTESTGTGLAASGGQSTPPSSKQHTVAPAVGKSTGEALERWSDDGGKQPTTTPPVDRGDFL